jgi:hypothetical protein
MHLPRGGEQLGCLAGEERGVGTGKRSAEGDHFAFLTRCLGYGAGNAVEVLVDRIQGEWLEFAEHAPQLLLDPIDVVKEGAAVNVQAPAAELPVRAEKEMKIEELILVRIKRAAAYEDEVCGVLLVFSAPGDAPAASRRILEGCTAHMLLLGHTVTELSEARTKDRAQNTVAGAGDSALFTLALSKPMALRARSCAKSQRFGSGPFHFSFLLRGRPPPASSPIRMLIVGEYSSIRCF